MGASDVERVEQTGHVVSHVRDGVLVIGPGAAAGIAVVEEDDTEAGGQNGDLLQRPQRRVVSDPHHQDERGAVSVNLVEQLLPIRADGSRSRDLLDGRGQGFLRGSGGRGIHDSFSGLPAWLGASWSHPRRVSKAVTAVTATVTVGAG